MDRPLTKTNWQRLRQPLSIGIGIALLAALWLVAIPRGGKTLQVAGESIQIASVSQGIFEDFTPLRGQVIPLRTVYLDAIEGGRVEKIHLEDGAEVSEGQPIVDISNARLKLDSIGREAQVSEQINNMQNLELSLVRTELEHKRALNELSYQIKIKERTHNRKLGMGKSGYVKKSELDDEQDELEFLKKKQALELESRTIDQALQKAQMKQIGDSVKNLTNNLEFTRENLDSLNVKAPIGGRLTAFDVEIGQSLKPGERFGQIDDPVNFKLAALVDEFYMSRVFIGQTAEMTFDEKLYTLEVKKIYPQVKDGQFRVDFVFRKDQPKNLNRGQTLQMRLQLGENISARLIPNGSFFQETGGNWIFVVASDKKTAVRRTIRVGRRNTHFIEVLEGLDVGEQVITSPYTSYVDIDRLNINQ
ncbi:ABC transporter permease [Cellvibrio zantedeschiae]|uniref:ABC transporter permease n=1 Tax=Cellvibrio zantedeschiae TaxID=1237077 RepID=A0ABQ3BEE2_9GAMM|nr:HlyD family efflux transporter periplasmic adaptor subunit [Cellvibrio zantedeschiae]GGY86297.1 ABC transporter permease [Cellvibrio zantedeschiae]